MLHYKKSLNDRTIRVVRYPGFNGQKRRKFKFDTCRCRSCSTYRRMGRNKRRKAKADWIE